MQTMWASNKQMGAPIKQMVRERQFAQPRTTVKRPSGVRIGAPHLYELGVGLCREDGVALEVGPHPEEVELINLRSIQMRHCPAYTHTQRSAKSWRHSEEITNQGLNTRVRNGLYTPSMQ